MADFSADNWQRRVDNLKPDDPLFISSGPDGWQSEALLDPLHAGGTWAKMILGYKYAADLLIELAPRSQIDLIVYPIIFLYRHHLELQLKYMNAVGASMLSGPSPRFNEHNLMVLWGATKQIL